jgi:hypothetical protein
MLNQVERLRVVRREGLQRVTRGHADDGSRMAFTESAEGARGRGPPR